MRICVLQSSYEGTDSALQDVDGTPAQPGLFTTEHTFSYRFIHKATAKEEIDALAAEEFDFYFNFMWGTLDDTVAGVLESRYFESLKAEEEHEEEEKSCTAGCQARMLHVLVEECPPQSEPTYPASQPPQFHL